MELKLDANNHFHQLFSKYGALDNATNHDFLSFILSLISAETNDGLIKPFFEQEMVDVI